MIDENNVNYKMEEVYYIKKEKKIVSISIGKKVETDACAAV